ncbi:hypothetical protein PPL_12355 [Heterostelium album PN500]|uniref:Ankyrin repeat protein n=1 Tax=Heterostelium pallidum (strain ATCC 26659 / Pp 5 / PN500) TaxID=670386 RepID=D3BLH8_HETP5|nr:hypothetical protein PPL_12355 [Heterostelium album PN500]EFA77743.1 hypothetical protein PPL_12355 [Heterostelium album PN500]|eukprot:XP_020429871.1 hypothetical protein PPL_12355 [Heterostelium album PN500]
MDKTIFTLVFHNRVLNKLIFDNVIAINAIFHLNKQEDERITYKWNQVIKEPLVLAGNNYPELLKQCLQDYRGSKRVKLDVCQLFDNTIFGGCSIATIEFLLDHFKISSAKTSEDFMVKLKKNVLLRLLIRATHFGRLDIIGYLFRKFQTFKWNYQMAMYFTAQSETSVAVRLEMMELFVSAAKIAKYAPHVSLGNHNNVFNSAAYEGDITMLEWLTTNRSEDLEKSDMFISAIVNGHLHLLEYLLKEHAALLKRDQENLIECAASLGRFDMVKILHAQGCVCNEDVLGSAAGSGNLEMLKWLIQNTTASLPDNVVFTAAGHGKLEVIQWLLANTSASYTTDVLINSITAGQLETTAWLLKNRPERPPTDIIDTVSSEGFLDTIKYLHENIPCTSENAIDLAAKAGHLDTIIWLHENRSENCTTKAMDSASENNYLETVKWLHENRSEGCSTRAVDRAAKGGHFEIVKFLLENRTEQCTQKALNSAIAHGDIDIIECITANVSHLEMPKFNETIESLDKLLSCNHYETVQWVLDNIEFPMEPLIEYREKTTCLYPNSTESLQVLNEHILKKENK